MMILFSDQTWRVPSSLLIISSFLHFRIWNVETFCLSTDILLSSFLFSPFLSSFPFPGLINLRVLLICHQLLPSSSVSYFSSLLLLYFPVISCIHFYFCCFRLKFFIHWVSTPSPSFSLPPPLLLILPHISALTLFSPIRSITWEFVMHLSKDHDWCRSLWFFRPFFYCQNDILFVIQSFPCLEDHRIHPFVYLMSTSAWRSLIPFSWFSIPFWNIYICVCTSLRLFNHPMMTSVHTLTLLQHHSKRIWMGNRKRDDQKGKNK